MNSYTTPAVDAIGQMHFAGNIIPIEWFKHIRLENGAPDLIAIWLLSDIVYWYRPTIIRDEKTGQVIAKKKKFKADLLQKSYQDYADLLGIAKLQVTRAIKRLESLGLIRRVFRNITVSSIPLSNVLFIELIPETLKAITFDADNFTPPPPCW